MITSFAVCLQQSTRMIEGIEVPLLILGDPAYPLLPWLIKPFIGINLSPEKESFNCYHSSVRISVEHAFGRLKARWRILGKKMDVNIDLAPIVIATCCALHNFCEKDNMSISPQEHASQLNQPGQSSTTTYDDAHGPNHQIREALMDCLASNQPLRQTSRYL